MSLQKTAKQDNPHAVFVNRDGWTFLVLKTYQKPEREKDTSRGRFARWFVAVLSPYTHGSFELGDSYVRDVSELVAATPEWLQAYSLDKPTITPRQWFFANNVDPSR